MAGLVLGLGEHQGVVMNDGSRRIGRLRRAGAVEIRDRHIYVTDADVLERLARTGR